MRFKLRIKMALSLLAGVIAVSVNAVTFTQEGFDYDIKPEADWIHQVTFKQPESDQHSSAAIWLLSDTQIHMQHPDYARFHHYAVKVNHENGLKDASEFGVYFLPDFQKLEINYVKRYRDDKVENLTKQVDIRLLQREEGYSQGIYDGGVTAMLLVKDVQVGDTIEYAYTINGRNPIFGDEYFTGIPLNWSVPVGAVYGRVVSDKPLNYQVVGKPEKMLKNKQMEGRYEYLWQESSVAAVYDEGEYPLWYDPYAGVRFSQYDNWGQVVEWAQELYQIPEITNPELIALSEQWAAESQSKKAFVEKVIRYAQNNIRYFGIEIGQNSHRPYSPDLVFESKFGDCKDKTMFINSLLARQGIKAYPALVSSKSRKAIKDRIPQPGAFDHVISTFELDGKNYWIDGTRQLQYGELEHIGISNFDQALVVKPGTQSLRKIDADMKPNELSLEEEYVSESYQKPVKLNAKFHYRYDNAENTRSFLRIEGYDNFAQSYKNFYNKQFPSIQLIGELNIQDDEAHNAMTVSMQFEIPDYWKQNQPTYEAALYGDIIADYITKPAVVSRSTPYAKAFPANLEHKVTIRYNDIVNWSLPERQLTIESDALVYERNIDFAEDWIQVTHSYQARQDHVATEEVAEYVNQGNEIRKALFYEVYIDNNEYQAAESSDLKSILKGLLKKNRGD